MILRYPRDYNLYSSTVYAHVSVLGTLNCDCIRAFLAVTVARRVINLTPARNENISADLGCFVIQTKIEIACSPKEFSKYSPSP